MSLVPFSFKGADVRLVTDDAGEPWFVARDVALFLEYADTDQAVRAHCKAAKNYPVEMTGQVRHVKVIPERDVYRLVMRSQMPAAEEFEEWVVAEVLPTIRRTGSYQRPMTPAEQLLAQAQTMVSLERQQAEQQVALERVEDRTAKLEQVRYLDSVPSGFETITSIRDRINHRHGLPVWVVNAVMREVSGAPLPFAMVRSRHAGEGGQPFAIWPRAAITRRFDQFVAQCVYVTAERATHPEILQDRFKIKSRSTR